MAIESLGLSLSISLSISGPLSVVVTIGTINVMSVAVVRNIALGGGVKSLGDWVQTCKKNNNN